MTKEQVVATARIIETVKENNEFAEFIYRSIGKYLTENWGDICQEDWKMNDLAVKNNDDRIVARYNHHLGDIYIITEHDRSLTTILFCDEY